MFTNICQLPSVLKRINVNYFNFNFLHSAFLFNSNDFKNVAYLLCEHSRITHQYVATLCRYTHQKHITIFFFFFFLVKNLCFSNEFKCKFAHVL